MYIYFDVNGTLKELINDTAIRQFDENCNDLYIYWEGEHAITSVWLTYVLKDDEGNEIQKIDKLTSDFVINGEIPYDKKRNLNHFSYGVSYDFYHAVIPDEILLNKGLVTCMIQMYQEDTAKTLGLLVFNVDSGVKITTDITTSEWEYLKALVAHLAESNVISVAGLTGEVNAIDLSNALIATNLFASKTDLANYVLKQTNVTSKEQVYGKTTGGTQEMIDVTPSAEINTIVKRDSNKNISVGDATSDDNALNRKTADERYVSKATTTSGAYAYVRQGTRDTTMAINSLVGSGAIVQRTSTGQIRANDASADNEVPTLKQVQDLVKSVNSINILNKNASVINATASTVQSVATNYVVTNYSRQPETYDGLIITMTDQKNDKILWMYTETSGEWINVGTDASEVDLSNYYTKDVVYTKNETNSLLNNKQDILTTAQLNACNSGITSSKVTTYDSYATSKQNALTTTQIANINNVPNKQDKLTAGNGIKIVNNVISLDVTNANNTQY